MSMTKHIAVARYLKHTPQYGSEKAKMREPGASLSEAC